MTMKKDDTQAWKKYEIEKKKLLEQLNNRKISQKTYDDELAQIIKKLKI